MVCVYSVRIAYALSCVTRACWEIIFAENKFFQKKEKNLKNFSKMLDIIVG